MLITETTLRILGRFFNGIGNWFSDRAHLRLVERMQREWPPGTRVRLVCDCRDPAGDHEGEWEVEGYVPDAGDYRLLRPGNTGNVTWARAFQLQRTTD